MMFLIPFNGLAAWSKLGLASTVSVMLFSLWVRQWLFIAFLNVFRQVLAHVPDHPRNRHPQTVRFFA
ncbi:Uncharacterised protein [Enterobacter hormaechei]|nr:Uncharacterised protein [Enterobacter hormaechei]CZV33688.1 Uncharacterised protein [Enterobacter hormaechei]CZW61485.1 Uncharacterised protein [Enterobacter hormaechei]CZX42030.1 Uncharacterised protein [Enterobacter hormaechei]CZX79610.1 Uncharacterised protein [Enterobacter hormaechei]